MEETATNTRDRTEPSERDSVHKTVSSTAITIAGCAVAVFTLGAVLDAAWPGAVAACGISILGMGVAWVMLKRC